MQHRHRGIAVEVWSNPDYSDEGMSLSPERMLAEVASKRAIVEDRVWPIGRFWDGQRAQHDSTLRLLAQPYAEHPDYDPTWRL